jgi:menaquinone-specific isochorismate synthase
MYESIPAHYGRLVSVSLPIEGVTLLDFLHHHKGQARFYNDSQRGESAFAGVGIALELFAYGTERFNQIQHHAAALFADALVAADVPSTVAPRLFGGFSFMEDYVPDAAWADFPPAHFVLPHYQLTRIGEVYWLTLNAHVPYGENPHLLLPELREALKAKIATLKPHPLSPPQSREGEQTNGINIAYPMPYDTWAENIVMATQRIKSGELHKVVLARVCEIRGTDRIDVDRALVYLEQAYPETYRFLFEPRPYHAFYGATPELLAEVQGNQVKTMALAGSIRRGKTPQEDAILGQSLLDDPKNRGEHRLVIEGIQEKLTPLTRDVTIGDTGLMRLTNIYHLHTPITGTLHHTDGILPVVAALHPTPALGGSPRDVAMALIQSAEPVPRGWYAAPIGWIDRHLDGAFHVAIRSAVAQEKRVWLYAGCGIVAESDPQQEWDETLLKFAPMLRAIQR